MQPVPAHTAPVSRRSLNSDSSLSLSLRHHFLKFFFKLVPSSEVKHLCVVSNSEGKKKKFSIKELMDQPASALIRIGMIPTASPHWPSSGAAR
jgi:hypothetical protein